MSQQFPPYYSNEATNPEAIYPQQAGAYNRGEIAMPRYSPKTAMNELGAFLSGLTEMERTTIMRTEPFASMFSSYVDKFLFWLIQSGYGAEYIASSPHRAEMAERVKLTAHHVYSDMKTKTLDAMTSLESENEALKQRLKEMEATSGGAK